MGSPFTIRLQNQCGLGVLDAALIDKQLRLLPSFPPGSTVCDGSDASENVRIIVSGLAYRCRWFWTRRRWRCCWRTRGA